MVHNVHILQGLYPLPLLNSFATLFSSSAQTTWLLSHSILQKVLKSPSPFPRRLSMMLSTWAMLLGNCLTIFASYSLINPPAALSSLSLRPVFTKTLSFSFSLKKSNASLFHELSGRPPELVYRQRTDSLTGSLAIIMVLNKIYIIHWIVPA